MTERAKKVAVISNHRLSWFSTEWRVQSYPWNRPDSIPYLSDFDTVIFDLSEVPEDFGWSQLFNQKLTFRTFIDVAAHGGEIIILGDPRERIYTRNSLGYRNEVLGGFLWWTGMDFHWRSIAGDTVTIKEMSHKFEGYVKTLRNYTYTLDSVSADASAIRRVLDIEDDQIEFSAECKGLACNRAGQIVAAQVSLLAAPARKAGTIDTYGRARRIADCKRIGPITILPINDRPVGEAMYLIMTECLGIPLSMPEPEWVQNLLAPGEAKVNKELSDLESQSRLLQQKLEAKELERAALRQCLKLLYTDGDDLENAVRETLQVLGATVDHENDIRKDDGFIEYNGLEAVLEIKSTEKEMFSEYGLKQLLQWQNDALIAKHKKYKGIFIGSNSIKKSPSARCFGYSDSFIKTAKAADLALIKGEQLLTVFRLKMLGQLSVERFWQQLELTPNL